MALADMLVVSRNAALDGLLGIDSRAVLNTAGGTPRVENASTVAASLKRAVCNLVGVGVDSQGTRVRYASLMSLPEYERYRTIHSASLRVLDFTTLPSREARLAFWINLYNALVIDAVISFGVRGSVTEGRAGRLAFFRRAAYLVGGCRFCCDDIEHGILRGNRGHPYLPGPQFAPRDPRSALVVHPPDVRVHFALNCGTRSCPPVGVYRDDQIDDQLDLAARSFIASDASVDYRRNALAVSQIFRWFAGDFGGTAGVRSFLLRYLPDDERRKWLGRRGAHARLVYRPYDWGLNAA